MKNRGFTLIEMVVVIVLLVIVARIGVISSRRLLQSKAKKELVNVISSEVALLITKAVNSEETGSIVIDRTSNRVGDFQGSEFAEIRYYLVEKDSDDVEVSRVEGVEDEITILSLASGNIEYEAGGVTVDIDYDTNLVIEVSTEDKGSSEIEIRNGVAGGKVRIRK